MSHDWTNAENEFAAACKNLAQVRQALQGGFIRGASIVLTGLERLQANLTRVQVLVRDLRSGRCRSASRAQSYEPLLAQAGGFLARWQHSLAEQGLVGDAYECKQHH